ncbi:MAG TPA: hypothetical protein VIH03_05235, partial [Nitrososphaerales archaeon]
AVDAATPEDDFAVAESPRLDEGGLAHAGHFCKFLHQDIHIASGIEFGLSHIDHIAIGNILRTISVGALAVPMFVCNKFRPQADKTTA